MAASVDEGDYFCRILFKGRARELFAVLADEAEVLKEGHFGASAFEFRGVMLA